jgi:hypothetical protein
MPDLVVGLNLGLKFQIVPALVPNNTGGINGTINTIKQVTKKTCRSQY